MKVSWQVTGIRKDAYSAGCRNLDLSTSGFPKNEPRAFCDDTSYPRVISARRSHHFVVLFRIQDDNGARRELRWPRHPFGDVLVNSANDRRCVN